MESLPILASASPRRKELLKKIFPKFDIVPSCAEETEEGTPVFVAESNARIKGESVKGDFVIACDTLVALDGVIYGKPGTEENAFEMLKILNGKTHQVVSGVYIRYFDKETVFNDISSVTFKNLSFGELKDYISEYKPLDKAGSYGIQDGVLVEKYTGSMDNIIGLPTEKLREEIEKICSQ